MPRFEALSKLMLTRSRYPRATLRKTTLFRNSTGRWKTYIYASENGRPEKTVGRIAAACFIFLLVSFSLTMVFSKEARAAVSRWTKQLFEGGIAYIFRGELDDAYTIPKIEPGWLPDGVELVQYEEVPDISYDYLYQNQDESKLILFGVGIVHEGSNMTVSDLEDYTHETVIWDGKTIEHYFLGEEDHTLWWFEDEDRIIVTVDCYLTTEELQLFISNLKRVN